MFELPVEAKWSLMLRVILKMFEVSSFTIFALPTTTESLKPHFCGFVVARSFILQVISNNYNYLAPISYNGDQMKLAFAF